MPPTKSLPAKQATYYGIGSALANIVEVMVLDRRSILTAAGPIG